MKLSLTNNTKKFPDFEAGLFDSSRNTADMAVKAIENNPERFAHLLNICSTTTYPLNMRSSRVIELCCEKNPSLILPYLDDIIEKIAISKTEGVKRSFLKVIAMHIDFNLVKDNAKLLQISFDWLISPRESVSVRYYCIIIIEKLCIYEPDLKHEFKDSLEFCFTESSPGFQNRALKALKKL